MLPIIPEPAGLSRQKKALHVLQTFEHGDHLRAVQHLHEPLLWIVPLAGLAVLDQGRDGVGGVFIVHHVTNYTRTKAIVKRFRWRVA